MRDKISSLLKKEVKDGLAIVYIIAFILGVAIIYYSRSFPEIGEYYIPKKPVKVSPNIPEDYFQEQQKIRQQIDELIEKAKSGEISWEEVSSQIEALSKGINKTFPY